MSSPQGPPKIEKPVDLPAQDPRAVDEQTVLYLDRYKSDTQDRKWLAQWSAIVVTVWMAIILFFVNYQQKTQGLSDTVMVTLLGTTTANVLGLMYIVLRGHFTRSGERKQKQ